MALIALSAGHGHSQQPADAQVQAVEQAGQLARRAAEFFERTGVDGFVCWFGKIEPYNVDDSYYLSVEDMERFGIRHVTVGEVSPGPGSEEVRHIRVDWAGLEAARPAVRLDQ